MDLQRWPSLDDIRQAGKRIEEYIHRTPILTCSAIDKIAAAISL